MTQFILAAVDVMHADTAAAVLKKARAIADMEQADLAVVTVIPDFGMSIVGAYFTPDAEQAGLRLANDKLHDLVRSALGDTKRIKHIVRHGTAYKEIMAAAEEIRATLIVMGAHRPELQDYLLGPNAARVVRHSRTSIYVLREPPPS